MALLATPFCYLYACTQKGHTMTNRYMYKTWFCERCDGSTFRAAPGYWTVMYICTYVL